MSWLSQLLMQLPAFLMVLSGFVLAGIFFQRARTAAILVILASVLTLLQSAFSIFTHKVLLERMIDGQLSNDIYSLIAAGSYTFFYIAISALLLAAAFTGRRPEPSPTDHEVAIPAPLNEASPTLTHRGALVLILGLLGLLMFAPLGIAAWIIGSKDLAAIRDGRMDKSGEGMTLAGKVLGIIATVLMLIGVLVLLAVMAILASEYSGY